MKTRNLLSMIAVGAFSVCSAAGMASAQDAKPAEAPKAAQPATDKPKEKAKDKPAEKQDKKDAKKGGVEVGAQAPEIKLNDTEGKEWTLASAVKEGKIVVLQWFNPGCPFVQKHYKETKTFNDLHAKYADKGVVFVAINSGAVGNQGAGAEANKKAKTDWAIPYSILLDESGTVGRAYGAKHTPEMFVIGKDGKVAYHGAIDDDSGGDKPGKTNYVAKALDELLAGTNVTTASTKPYGCPVKYGKN